MWCIGELTPEYRERMYDILDLYNKEYNKFEPVVCIDEKSKQLVADSSSRLPLLMAPGQVSKVDYEYERKGTCNFFVCVEPKGGKRYVRLTYRRTKKDFVSFILYVLTKYKKATKIHIVLDNLNTHFRKAFEDIIGKKKTSKLFKKIIFHHTPKHASWLNMAENEIGVLDRQYLNRRIDNFESMKTEVKAWEKRRNREHCTIKWTVTKKDIDKKLRKHYVK
jgi:hypothetical protein